MSTFVHIKWAYTQPLVIMCIMLPLQIWDNKAVKKHLLGMEVGPPSKPMPPARPGGDGMEIETPPQTATAEMEAPLVHVSSRRKEAELLHPADPTLLRPLCRMVLEAPVRTARGHTIYAECVNGLRVSSLIPSCPECHGPIGTTQPLQPDRFAEQIVGGLQCPCPLRNKGCPWIGTRSGLAAHAKECRSSHAWQRPSDSCKQPAIREQIQDNNRAPTFDFECPWGCGERIAGGDKRLEDHRSACPREPRRLLATVQRLQLQNQQLTMENKQLRSRAARPAVPALGPGVSLD